MINQNVLAVDGKGNISIQDITHGVFNINPLDAKKENDPRYYLENKYPKELTLNLPKTHYNDIIGREKDLIQLHELLSEQKRAVVLNGLGGIGKTTLAEVYVSKFYDYYNHIVWITQTSENLKNDVIHVPGLLKNLNIKSSDLEPKELFEEVIRRLKGIPQKVNLLIIDNAEQSIEKYKDMLPEQPNWHLLITSREEIDDFYQKTLGFLSEEQAIALFKKHYRYKQLSEQEIKDLVGLVDYHTLTIEIIAKTAAVQRYDAALLKQSIEKDLRANIKVAHNRTPDKIEKIGSYLQTVFSLSRLNKNEIWLIKQLICLPSEFHTYQLLKELIVDEQDENTSIFSEILTSLVQKGWLMQNHESDSYKMHRIIIEVAKKELPISIDEMSYLISSITEKLKIDYAKDNPVEKFMWVPYAQTLIGYFDGNTADVIAKLYNNLGLLLQDLGNYQAAKLLLEKAVESAETHLGSGHSITAIRYSNLATVLQCLGNYKEAKLLLEKAVQSDKENFGQDHPNTASSYSNLATVLQNLKDYQGAKLLLEKAVQSAEKNFGKNHPTTFLSYSNLAMVLKDLGDYHGAKSLLQKTLLFNEESLGQDHPTTAVSYSNLATVFQDQGNYREARSLLEKAVKSAEKNFGPKHPTTAIRYSKLAMILQRLGECEQALELSKMTLDVFNEKFSTDHPYILQATKIYQSIKNEMDANA